MKEKDYGDGEQMERKGRPPNSQLSLQVLKHYQPKEKPGNTSKLSCRKMVSDLLVKL